MAKNIRKYKSELKDYLEDKLNDLRCDFAFESKKSYKEKARRTNKIIIFFQEVIEDIYKIID